MLLYIYTTFDSPKHFPEPFLKSIFLLGAKNILKNLNKLFPLYLLFFTAQTGKVTNMGLWINQSGFSRQYFHSIGSFRVSNNTAFLVQMIGSNIIVTQKWGPVKKDGKFQIF